VWLPTPANATIVPGESERVGRGQREERKRASATIDILRGNARSLARGSAGPRIIESRRKNRASHRDTKANRGDGEGQGKEGEGGIIKIDSTEVVADRPGLASAAGREIAANLRRLIGATHPPPARLPTLSLSLSLFLSSIGFEA